MSNVVNLQIKYCNELSLNVYLRQYISIGESNFRNDNWYFLKIYPSRGSFAYSPIV